MQQRKGGLAINFIGIGAAKSATTWIAQCLREHPEVCMSTTKETSYFMDNTYSFGPEWYARHFAHCGEQKIKGEFSPQYLNRPEVPARIKKDFPAAKLILCVRNPVERFLSAYYFKRSTGRICVPLTKETIEADLQEEIDRSMYAKHLKHYLEYFPREQILILFQEDIEKDPMIFIQKVYEFLEINKDFTPPSLYRKENVTAANLTYSLSFHRFMNNLRKRFTHNKTATRFVPFLKRAGVHKLIKSIIDLNKRKSAALVPSEKNISAETREYIASFFRDDTLELERVTKRNLVHWR